MDAQLLRVLCVLGKTLMCRNDKSYRPKARGTNANAVCSAHKEKPEGKIKNKVLKRDLNHWTHCAAQFYTQPHWLIFGSPFLRQDNNSSAFSGWNRQLSKKHSHKKKKKNTRQEERKAQKACVLVFDTRRDVIICYLCLLNVTIPYIQPNVDCHILHTSQPHRTETHTNSGYLRFTQRFSSKAERT